VIDSARSCVDIIMPCAPRSVALRMMLMMRFGSEKWAARSAPRAADR
jgi:hypothetical protein